VNLNTTAANATFAIASGRAITLNGAGVAHTKLPS